MVNRFYFVSVAKSHRHIYCYCEVASEFLSCILLLLGVNEVNLNNNIVGNFQVAYKEEISSCIQGKILLIQI